MSEFNIRPARPEDSALILHFVRELAEYEQALHEVKATEADFERALFAADAKAHCVICDLDEEPVGMALYFYNYSTWTGKYGLYLEDLYIAPQYRGNGAGKALLKHLARIAIEQDCSRYEWNVLNWNEPAIKFYESFGAKAQSEWVGYRLCGQALSDFANSD